MRKLLLLVLGLSAPVCLGLAIRSLAFETDGFEFGRLLEHPSKLLEPAPLAPVHRTEPGCADCTACHDLTHGVPTPKCLACHEEIGRRAAGALGHHGRDLLGDCISCHNDHVEKIVEFDPNQFNHLRAEFALEGRHQTVECDQCHKTPGGFRYLGLSFASCQDCHEDPHLGSLSERRCVSCHSAEGWNGPLSDFNHDTETAFALDNLHDRVTCAACHETSVYGSTPETCAGCHAEYDRFLEGDIADGVIWPADPHLGLVTCQQCHPGDAGGSSANAHARRCADCHTERYADLYRDRLAHLSAMAARVESPQMRLLFKVGSHNYVEAEKRARALVESLGGF